MRKSFTPIVWLSFLAAACSSGTEPRVLPCSAQNSVMVGSLTVGSYTSFSPSGDGCALFAANAGTDTIEYVVVAHSVTSDPNRSAVFRLAGDAMMAPASAMMAALQAAESRPSIPEAFHTMLRETEARRDYGPITPGAKTEMASVQSSPPQIGDQRAFKVCSTLQCQPPMTTVQAIVKAVGQRIAVYVDFDAQSNFTQADYDEMVQVFDQRLYPLDTLAFGGESDVDGNGVVMVLMTPRINRLVTSQQCVESGFVAGYFFGADLDPNAINNVNYNHGEVFYTLVPDPAGEYSCSHSVARVKQLIPQVFVHEMQHMISFNHHVLKASGQVQSTEVLWLNEALSHYAEELGGRTYLPGDNPTFSAYLNGNVRNAYEFMSHSGDHFLLATFGSGTLGERGAGWLFMRFLIDQLAADTTMAAWHAVTRQMVQTTNLGAANIESITGQPLEQTLSRWLLAMWVSDLPGFTAPPELKYRSWRFRTTFGGLCCSGQFALPYPLVPGVSIGIDVDIQGTLRAGTGVFERVRQPGGSGSFTLQLAEPDGGPVHPGVKPRLTILRVK